MAVRYSYLPFHLTHLIKQADEDENTSETLFNLLYEHTPSELLPQPSLAEALTAKPAVSKQRDLIARMVETADIDYHDFYQQYKHARANEAWMQELKVKRAGKKMFRDAWANKIRTDASFWGDVNVIAVWTDAAKTVVNLVDKTLHYIYRIAPTDGDNLPEKDADEKWRCLYLMLESPTSCQLHRCDITDADGKVVFPGAIFPHKGYTQEWDELMQRIKHDEWSLHEVDSAMKQAAQAARLSLSSDSDGKIPPTPPPRSIKATSSEDTVTNPQTGRKVKVGSKTYLALVKAGVIKA